MNKKLIKTIASVVCGLGIVGTVPAVVTSCGTKYIIKGSTELKGEVGQPGRSDDKYALYKNDEEVEGKDIEWSVVDEKGGKVDGVSCSDGYVAWMAFSFTKDTDIKFYVNAKCDGNEYKSKEITLKIVKPQPIVHDYKVVLANHGTGDYTVGVEGKTAGTAGSDTNTGSVWSLTDNGEEVKNNFTFKLMTLGADPQPISGLSITNGLISWNETITTFQSFKVHAFVGDEDVAFCDFQCSLELHSYKVVVGGDPITGDYTVGVEGKTAGTAGTDTNTARVWSLTDDNKPVTANVSFKLMSIGADPQPISGLSITKGLISWDNTVSSDTQTFKVYAFVGEEQVAGSNITCTLTLPAAVTWKIKLNNVAGSSYDVGVVNAAPATAGWDSNTTNLWSIVDNTGAPVTGATVTWSVLEDSAVSTIFTIPTTGDHANLINWTNLVQAKTYNLKVKAHVVLGIVTKDLDSEITTITWTIPAHKYAITLDGSSEESEYAVKADGATAGTAGYDLNGDATPVKGIWSFTDYGKSVSSEFVWKFFEVESQKEKGDEITWLQIPATGSDHAGLINWTTSCTSGIKTFYVYVYASATATEELAKGSQTVTITIG